MAEYAGAGKFWEFLSESAGIDQILNQLDVSLSTVLCAAETLQEFRAGNSKLTNYFCDNFAELVAFATTEPPADSSEDRKFKIPFNAVEVLTCDSEKLVAKISENFEVVMEFLEKSRPPVNPVLAGYFGKIVISMCMRKRAALAEWIKPREEEISRYFLANLENSSIADAWTRLNCVDEGESEIFGNFNFSKMVDLIAENSENEILAENVSRVFTVLVESSNENLEISRRIQSSVTTPENLKKLFSLKTSGGYQIVSATLGKICNISPPATPWGARLDDSDDVMIDDRSPQGAPKLDDIGDAILAAVSDNLEIVALALANAEILLAAAILNFLENFAKLGGAITEKVAESVCLVFRKFQKSAIIQNSILGISMVLRDARPLAKIFIPEIFAHEHSIFACGVTNCIFSKFPEICEAHEKWASLGVAIIQRWHRNGKKLAEVPSTPASSAIGRNIAIDLPLAGSPQSPQWSNFPENSEEWTANWE